MKKLNNLKWFSLGMAVCLVVAMFTVPATASPLSKTAELIYGDIRITLNGTTVIPKDANGKAVEPFTIDGTTYLPVRAIGNALGLDIKWNDITKTIEITDSQITPTHKPAPTPTVPVLNTALQRDLTTRINVCMRIGRAAYNDLQVRINDYISRGMGRSSGAQTVIAAQDSIKSDVMVMEGMLICIRDAKTNEELSELENHTAYFELIYLY